MKSHFNSNHPIIIFEWNFLLQEILESMKILFYNLLEYYPNSTLNFLYKG